MHPMNGLKMQQPFSAPIFVTLSCSRVASSCLRTNIHRSERCEGGMPPGIRTGDQADAAHALHVQVGAWVCVGIAVAATPRRSGGMLGTYEDAR